MQKKGELFDEFGNYFGDVEDSDDSEDSFDEEDEKVHSENQNETNGQATEEAKNEEEPKQEVVLFEDKNYYPTLQEAFPEAEIMIEEEDAMDIEEPILPPPQTQKYHLTGADDGRFDQTKNTRKRGSSRTCWACPRITATWP